MNLYFLGTGAADFGKELKTACCDRFDRNIRRSCALLADDRLLIDCGPHTLHALEIADKSPEKMTDILITHTHSDHFVPADILCLMERAGHPVQVHGGAEALDILRTAGADNALLHPVRFGEAVDCGGYTVTPLYGNHLTEYPEEHTYHYLLEHDGAKLFYACDGAWMLTRTAKFLKNAALDMLIIDCTVGDYEGDFRTFEHNSMPMLHQMESGMRTLGILRPDTRIVLDHIARTLHHPYAETVKIAAEYGYEVAYDGLEITCDATQKGE